MGRMQRQTKFKIADGVGIDYDDNEAVPDLEGFQRYLGQDYWTINKAACYLLGYSDDALEDTDHERSEQSCCRAVSKRQPGLSQQPLSKPAIL